MEIKARVKAIGDQALTTGDPMVILFNETASAALREVAVIQAFDQPAQQGQVTLKVGSQITIDHQEYQVAKMGSLVNENLQSIGHVTLLFSEDGPSGLQNAILLNPEKKPVFTVGTEIIYHN